MLISAEIKQPDMFGVIVILTNLLSYAGASEIQYHSMEESPVDTVIGNLFKNAFSSTSQSDQLKILNFKDKAVNCFKINSRGDLVIAKKIDRDTVCKNQTPNPNFSSKSEILVVDECKITLQVASQSNNMIVRVVVIIEDINDNSPKWNQNRIDVKFTDGCKEHTRVTIPPATDTDTGHNGYIEYSIKERDIPFRIINVDGLYIETLQSIDREAKDSYKFTMVATDKGHPTKSSDIDVFVTIDDINDNNPTFFKTIYQFPSISENCAIGTIVGKLEATDSDSGVNGKFHFKFAISVQSVTRNYFSVHSDGTVTVVSSLDCDRGDSQYKFKVIVEDEALPPYTRSGEATVIITINDVNDESPELKLIYMNHDPQSNTPYVIEHSRVGTLVGILEVHDPDFNGNDVVVCRDPPFFTLIHEDRQSKYKIVTNIELDREKTNEVTLVIICQDAAGNTASANQSILIKDINDNPPSFSKALYLAKIRENMPINSQLSEKVVASDLDTDSLIQYSMMKDYAMNFSIDRDSGIISTKVSFDREESSSYIIKVLATDATHGIINTGTGTVQVLIIDENDNKPIFANDFYSFHVSENNMPPTKIGVVDASDLDSADQQNSLRYYLDHSLTSRNFQIDHRTGLIKAMTSLDREKMTHYIFTVFAEDGQNISPRRHVATSTVTVVIDDVNDNSPKFIIPNATKNSFEVSIKETVGHKITYIVAEDQDYLDNSRITYSIESGNDLSLFSIDPTSGLLFLSDSLQSAQRHSFLLTLTACDAGKPRPLCTDFKNLRIVVKTGLDTSLKSSDTYTDVNKNVKPSNVHQEAIIICLAVVFITLLASSAVLVILMKCKPALWCRRSTRSNAKDKRFETCVNSQMLPTIDGNVKEKDIDETMRNFSSENQTWQPHVEQIKLKSGNFGYAIDHTTRPDYQTLESLCLASSMRCTPQPRFIDPCSQFQTLTPFLSQHDLKRNNAQQIQNHEGQHHIYQSVEDSNTAHFYGKSNDIKRGFKYNTNDNNINPMTNDLRNKDMSKYTSYAYNEASFV